MTDRLRILYIYPDTISPSPDKRRNALHFLGRFLSGDVLAVTIPSERNTPEAMAAAAEAIGGFQFCSTRVAGAPRLLRKPAQILKFLQTAIARRASGGPYDAIIAHGVYRTGMVGLLLSLAWRRPLMIELMGHPYRGFELDKRLIGRFKRLVAPYFVSLVFRRSHAIRLLYPSQIADLGSTVTESLVPRMHVFHSFVPVSCVAQGPALRSREILFVGFPWYLKGVDILISAFLRLADDFPDVTLRIVGYCPDVAPWKELAGHHPRVMFSGPLPNEQVVEMMRNAAVFVLPSRTEAMGRVLLEAMAAGTPVIAARVDGVPHYIRDGLDGLLFDREDVEGLETALRRVLMAPDEAQVRAERAREKTLRDYSEERYAQLFSEAVLSAIERFSRTSNN